MSIISFPFILAVIIVFPPFMAVTTPFSFTVAIDVSSELQSIVYVGLVDLIVALNFFVLLLFNVDNVISFSLISISIFSSDSIPLFFYF